jgi:hypothetical protein
MGNQSTCKRGSSLENGFVLLKQLCRGRKQYSGAMKREAQHGVPGNIQDEFTSTYVLS